MTALIADRLLVSELERYLHFEATHDENRMRRTPQPVDWKCAWAIVGGGKRIEKGKTGRQLNQDTEQSGRTQSAFSRAS